MSSHTLNGWVSAHHNDLDGKAFELRNGKVYASGFSNNTAAAEYATILIKTGTPPVLAFQTTAAASKRLPQEKVAAPVPQTTAAVPKSAQVSVTPEQAKEEQKSMANASTGGLAPTSQYSVGSTRRKVQAAASESTGVQVVKDMLLAKNYVAKSGGVTEFDTRLADWYRDGKPSTSKERLYDRNPKTINPMDDEAPAALRVFGRNKKNAKSGDVELVPPFTKFILESMNEGHSERSQIVETFGTFYVFLFGERPPTYSFSGTLINAKDINWRTDFQFYYDNYLRGSKCVENSAKLVMTYGGRQIEGFMLNFQTVTDASAEMGVKVSFQVVVTNRISTLNRSIDFGILNNNGTATADATITNLLNEIAGAEGKTWSKPEVDRAYQETTAVLAGSSASGPVSAKVQQLLIA